MIATILLAATLAAPVEVRSTTTPIRIDARLDEAAWTEATPIPVAYEWYPADNTAAPVSTEALVTYDDRNLYVAFRAKDPKPGLIRARFHERDAATGDDLVGFLIDPFNDDRRAYQFRINPLGVQVDAINSDVEGTEDFTWDGIWDSAGMVTADGYIVEVAVPLQQLRIPSRGGAQTWGFLAIREWPRDVQHRLRSVPTDQNRNCLVCQFQDLRGFETKAAGRNVEITPTLTGTNEDAFDAGVSARWAFTPGTSLQATINPDFSQVEADAAQLDVNTRFALFFPEKRPFFVEASDFFETRMPLVFTRTIADPAAGLKLTGKTGPHLYGLLVARDEITNL
ncbi:MAG TPA: sugar-binding protein, partial [Thermoanaerobaculia bacterium]